jgi:hypothetical protein
MLRVLQNSRREQIIFPFPASELEQKPQEVNMKGNVLVLILTAFVLVIPTTAENKPTYSDIERWVNGQQPSLSAESHVFGDSDWMTYPDFSLQSCRLHYTVVWKASVGSDGRILKEARSAISIDLAKIRDVQANQLPDSDGWEVDFYSDTQAIHVDATYQVIDHYYHDNKERDVHVQVYAISSQDLVDSRGLGRFPVYLAFGTPADDDHKETAKRMQWALTQAVHYCKAQPQH